jgi:outer membrane lipoprotein-sorting protein
MKYLLLLVGLIQFSAFSQDAKAQGILDNLSKKMKSQNSFYIEFSAKTENKTTGLNDSQTGKGWVKGEKFCASFGENTIISNGMKTWTVVKEEKSVYESDSNEGDDQSINPKKLMTIWESGFKNKYDKETTLSGEACHVINLYPNQPGEVEYHTVILYISKGNELKKAIMKMKDGTTMTYHLTKYEGNTEVSDSQFVFNPKKYPGYTVIRD